jgi:hypothetical protein
VTRLDAPPPALGSGAGLRATQGPPRQSSKFPVPGPNAGAERRKLQLHSGLVTFALQAVLTLSAILIAGYHSGIEDDAIYLPAIKKLMNPALYPHDAQFFTSQANAFLLLRLVAASARITRVPLEWVQLGWHVASVFLVIAGSWYVAERCFSELRDRFAAVALVSVLLTMPVAGTALYIADQHLHPRTLACAAILFATGALLDRRYTLAAFYSFLALLLHPLMAMFGVTYLIFLALPLERWCPIKANALAGLPLPIIMRPSPAWREAALTRTYIFLWTWKWFEWLGVFAPMALLWWFSRLGEKIGSPALSRICSRLVIFSAVMTGAGLVVGIPAWLDWSAPIQPMRHLQLVYLLMALAAGGLFAHYVLQNRPWRWLALFLPLCGGMLYAQVETFPTSAHIEVPGAPATNRWVRCFLWVRQNTPQDAYFAVNPGYMSRPDEEHFGFRAIAERSKLADYSKDAAVVTVNPDLASTWKTQVDSMRNFENFSREDFLRLREEFGTDWALVEKEVPGLSCPYHQDNLAVCRIE